MGGPIERNPSHSKRDWPKTVALRIGGFFYKDDAALQEERAEYILGQAGLSMSKYEKPDVLPLPLKLALSSSHGNYGTKIRFDGQELTNFREVEEIKDDAKVKSRVRHVVPVRVIEEGDIAVFAYPTTFLLKSDEREKELEAAIKAKKGTTSVYAMRLFDRMLISCPDQYQKEDWQVRLGMLLLMNTGRGFLRKASITTGLGEVGRVAAKDDALTLNTASFVTDTQRDVHFGLMNEYGKLYILRREEDNFDDRGLRVTSRLQLLPKPVGT